MRTETPYMKPPTHKKKTSSDQPLWNGSVEEATIYIVDTTFADLEVLYNVALKRYS